MTPTIYPSPRKDNGSLPTQTATQVNDVHSALNLTSVARILHPTNQKDIINAVRSAQAAGAAIAVSGGRHAMGGQQFASDQWLLDMRCHSAVRHFDAEHGLLTVDAGIQWPALITACQSLPPAPDGSRWGIRQKQTGADRLTLGGSLAANIHGRGLRLPPIVADVESFTLVGPDGECRRCSRDHHADWFALAIGGYGLFGVIDTVTLRLAPRVPVRRHVEILTLDELIRVPEERDTTDWLFGDFQYAIDEKSDDFLQRGVFSAYRRCETKPDEASLTQKSLHEADWVNLLALAHTDRARAFDTYANYYLSTHGQLYWSDTHQLSIYPDDYHAKLDHRFASSTCGSEMISELYVPRSALRDFMSRSAEYLRTSGAIVIYGTIRLIERDTDTFLPWAREPWACIIFNLHCDHTSTGLASVAKDFRTLIDIALSFGGSYYLTYHRWATRAQVETAHPHFAAFLAEKIKRDPHELFTSNWYQHYRQMFCDG
jgi:hypothetical protein